MSNTKIILYGIGGPSKQYAVLGYYRIFEDELDIVGTIRREAEWLRANNPSILHVYMISNRRGLRRDYQEAVRVGNIESYAMFKDILEREGMRVPV